MGVVATRSVRQEITTLAHEELTWVEFSKAASDALRRVVPFERHCWRAMDPATLLFTGVLAENLGPEPRLPYYEYAISDVNQFASLAGTRRRAATLVEATEGHPERSPRYRDLMAPRGLRDELRASFVDRGSCWGGCSLFRGSGEPDFAHDEIEAVAGLAGELAVGFRRALLVSAVDVDDSAAGPGIVVFDADGKVETVSPVAEQWLSELVDIEDTTRRAGVPYVVGVVFERARRAATEGDRPELAAHCRAPTRSGRWVMIRGTRLDPLTKRIAVIIEPAPADEATALALSAFGLSQREREVASCCLEGRSTVEIARELQISGHTVQDHLKAIFEKVGVRSRRELVARLFIDHAWPRFRSVNRNDGWFAAELDRQAPLGGITADELSPTLGAPSVSSPERP